MSEPSTPTEMSAQDLQAFADQARAQAKAVLNKIPLLGAVAWLMMNHAATRHTLLSELEWRVMPALALDQAKLYMREEAPVAFVSWAVLSPAVAQRYAGGRHQLMPSDWRSGSLDADGQAWVIDLMAPFGGTERVLEELRAGPLAGHPVRQLLGVDASLPKVMTWPSIMKNDRR